MRLQAIKNAIIEQEKRKFEQLSKQYKKNKKVDIEKGRCCCKYENKSGARCIQVLDIIFIANLPRWLFAVWSRVDNDRWPTYCRIRSLTFWLFWGLSIGGVIAYSFYQVFELELANADLFVNTLIALACLSLACIVDYHFCQVIKYHTKSHIKRIEKERKERDKK